MEYRRLLIPIAFAVMVLGIAPAQVIHELPRVTRWDGTNNVLFFGAEGLRRNISDPVRAYSVDGVKRGSDIDIFKDFPAAQEVLVDDIAAGPDGRTFVAAIVNFRHTILTYSADGKLSAVWNTAPYATDALAADENGGVYALSDRLNFQDVASPHPLLLHYDSRGQVIGSGLPSNTFKNGDESIYDADDSHLEAVLTRYRDRLYVYAPTGREILVCTTGGQVLRKVNLTKILHRIAKDDSVDPDIVVRNIAFSGDGHAVLDLHEQSSAGRALDTISVLNLKTNRVATALSRSQANYWLLLGTKAERILYLQFGGERELVIQSYPKPSGI